MFVFVSEIKNMAQFFWAFKLKINGLRGENNRLLRQLAVVH